MNREIHVRICESAGGGEFPRATRLELVMAFEEAFNFEIADEDAEQMRKVKDVLEYVKKRWKPGV